jgi:hypothetical protein
MKEIEDCTRRSSHVHDRQHKYFEHSHVTKIICEFNAIPLTIPMTFFTEKKSNPKLHMEAQKTQNSQNNLEQKCQCCITAPTSSYTLS